MADNLDGAGDLFKAYFDARLEYAGCEALVLIVRRGRRLYALHDSIGLAHEDVDCAIRRSGRQGLALQPFEAFVAAADAAGWWDSIKQ